MRSCRISDDIIIMASDLFYDDGGVHTLPIDDAYYNYYDETS